MHMLSMLMLDIATSRSPVRYNIALARRQTKTNRIGKPMSSIDMKKQLANISLYVRKIRFAPMSRLGVISNLNETLAETEASNGRAHHDQTINTIMSCHSRQPDRLK